MGKGTKRPAGHEQGQQNARATVTVKADTADVQRAVAEHLTMLADLRGLLAECSEFLAHEGASTEARESNALADRCEAMLSQVVAMDDDAVPPGITHQHHVHATQEAASLAHELDVLVTRVEGMGNQLLVARASTFVTTLAKDVTRLLTNPGTVLRHPSLDFDLLCHQADVHDDGRVFCHLRAYGGEDDRSYMFQFDSLYPAGLVDDALRVMVRGLTEAITVDTLAKLRELGELPVSDLPVGERLADPPQSETVHHLGIDPDQVVTVYGAGGEVAGLTSDQGWLVHSIGDDAPCDGHDRVDVIGTDGKQIDGWFAHNLGWRNVAKWRPSRYGETD